MGLESSRRDVDSNLDGSGEILYFFVMLCVFLGNCTTTASQDSKMQLQTLWEESLQQHDVFLQSQWLELCVCLRGLQGTELL